MFMLDRAPNLQWVEPTFPPRPKRTVIFSLIHHKGCLYFVNNSDETITAVSSDSYGFVENIATGNNPKASYHDVKPNEGVKVECYDDFYDLDYVLGLYIMIESPKWGKIEITPKSSKGGAKAQALVYEDGTTPLYVGLKTIKG